MNKFYLVIILLFACTFGLKAQSGCATEATPEQYKYLSFHKYAQIGIQNLRSQAFNVPIQIHIIRKSDGKGGLQLQSLKEELDKINELFSPAKIQFYLSGPVNYIDNDKYYNFNQADESVVANDYDVENVINIYFAYDLRTKSGSQICGYSYMPSGKDRIFINNGCLSQGATFAHELGHYFSLYHTHGSSFTDKELADGSNCQDGGDEICDTPADPNLNGAVDSKCNYTGGKVDMNGNPYHPDTKNIMSYSYNGCKQYFTNGQYERMLFSYFNDRNYLSAPDTFELEIMTNASDEELDITLYPNPSNGNFNISIGNELFEKVSVAVYDVTGRLVQNLNLNNQIQGNSIPVDITGYEKGLYLVQIIADNRAISERIIYQ